MSGRRTPTYREAWLPTLVMVGFTVGVFVVMVIRSRDEDQSEAL